MTTKHTPGPWQAKQQYVDHVTNGQAWRVLWPDTSKGGVWLRRLDDKGDFIEADARLIAAAPSLLEALQNALNVMAGLVTGDLKEIKANSPAIAQARAALALAGKGEA